MAEIMKQEQIIDGSKAIVIVIFMKCSMPKVLETNQPVISYPYTHPHQIPCLVWMSIWITNKL